MLRPVKAGLRHRCLNPPISHVDFAVSIGSPVWLTLSGRGALRGMRSANVQHFSRSRRVAPQFVRLASWKRANAIEIARLWISSADLAKLTIASRPTVRALWALHDGGEAGMDGQPKTGSGCEDRRDRKAGHHPRLRGLHRQGPQAALSPRDPTQRSVQLSDRHPRRLEGRPLPLHATLPRRRRSQ